MSCWIGWQISNKNLVLYVYQFLIDFQVFKSLMHLHCKKAFFWVNLINLNLDSILCMTFIYKYLHFIRNARLKSIRSSEWYLPITARPIHFWHRNILRTTFFHGNIAQLYQFTHVSFVYLRVENWINLKRYKIFSEQLCTLWSTFWCSWYITKIDMVYFHY